MAVAFVNLVPQWGSASPSSSGSFTPAGAGNTLVVAALDGTGAGKTFTFSGTGSYSQLTPPGNQNDSGGNTVAAGVNLSCSSGAQTATIAATAGDGIYGLVIEYSGVSTATSVSVVSTATPGTGSGALVGTAMTVPSGGMLVAVVMNVSTGNGTITQTAGTQRGSGGNGANTWNGQGWNATDYAGSGGSITPAFTCTAGGTDTFDIWQFLLSPPGGGSTDPVGQICI